MYCVYVTCCQETGHFYIGKSSNARIKAGYRGSGVWVQRAAKLHTLYTFIVHEVEDEEEAYALEELYVGVFLGDKLLRNMSAGGRGLTSEEVKKFTDNPEVRAKQSAFSRAYCAVPENMKARSENRKQYYQDERNRLKTSQAIRAGTTERSNQLKREATLRRYLDPAERDRTSKLSRQHWTPELKAWKSEQMKMYHALKRAQGADYAL